MHFHPLAASLSDPPAGVAATPEGAILDTFLYSHFELWHDYLLELYKLRAESGEA